MSPLLWSALLRSLQHGPSRLLVLLVPVIVLWAWGGPLPPLANTNASASTFNATLETLKRRVAEREQAAQAAAVLDGPRGDFEKRGIGLRSMPAAEQSAAANALAADASLVEQLASAMAAEREALQAYDAALMARTRDLGPRAESLRAATWPIVEHLKHYPPPLGLRSDRFLANAAFFAERASILQTSPLEDQITAAIEIGRSTYSLTQVAELDQTYRKLLDEYAATLQTQLDQRAPPLGWLRLTGAAISTLLLTLLLLGSVVVLDVDRSSWSTPVGLLALALWYGLPMPAAWVGAAALVALIVWRPGWAALLPLIGVPFYYRPRSLGQWSFTLNETLLILMLLGLSLAAIWRWQQGRIDLRALLADVWRSHRPWLLAGGLLLLSSGLGLLSPALVAMRPALRELRRTVIEPLIWAGLAAFLLRQRQLQARHMLWSLILGGAFVAADALIRFVLGREIWATGTVPRLIGVLPSSTALGVYLGACLAATSALALSAPCAERLAARLLCGPLVLATALTFTRGAWIGVGVALLVVLLVRQQWRLVAGLAAGGGGIGLALLLVAPGLLTRLLRVGEGTGTARLEIWAAAARAIQHAPLLGLGLDQFAHIDAAQFGIPQLRFLTLSHPHQLWLEAWLQLGIVGVLGLLIGVGGLLRWLWAARAQPLALAALAILIDLLVHGLLDQTLFGGDLIYIWWMIFVMANHQRYAITEEVEHAGRLLRTPLSAGVAD